MTCVRVIPYKCFVPGPDPADEGEKATLDELKNYKGSGKFQYQFFERTQFELSAATDYVIINPERPLDDTVTQQSMFLRLPIQTKGEDYWIEVEPNSTNSFTARFRELWNRSSAASSSAAP